MTEELLITGRPSADEIAAVVAVVTRHRTEHSASIAAWRAQRRRAVMRSSPRDGDQHTT